MGSNYLPDLFLHRGKNLPTAPPHLLKNILCSFFPLQLYLLIFNILNISWTELSTLYEDEEQSKLAT